MRYVLVAEDDPNIALALCTIIKKGVPDTEVIIAENGMEALSVFQKNKIDLVMSDWNMPVMTGGELLSVIRNSENNPSVPFLMLTARADSESVKSAINGDVTEYIVKPFDNAGLLEKVISVLGESESGKESSVEEDVSVYQKIIDLIEIRIKKGYLNFPVLPDIGMKAIRIINNNDNSLDDVAALIRTDQSMSAKIIAVSNSSFYRGRVPIETIESALTRIGLKEAGNIILAFFLRELFKNEKGAFGIRLKHLWEHSLTTAIVAKAIAIALNLPVKERLYAAALLHDIGRLILIPVLRDLKNSNKELTEIVVDEVLSTLHIQIGMDLLKHWDFTPFFINVVRHHHDNEHIYDVNIEVQVVMLADLLSKIMQKTSAELDIEDENVATLMKVVGLNRIEVNKIMSESADEVLRVKRLYNT